MLLLPLTSYAILIVMMTAIWLVFRRIDNAAIVDVGWGSGFVIVGLVYAIQGQGLFERRLLVGSLMILWGGRLAWHLLKDRVLSGKPEDGRYKDFREKWKVGINTKFFVFFQFQALLVVLFSIPMLLVASNTASTITTLEWIGVVVWLAGVIGESTADYQLKKFKDDPANKGRTCQRGLWMYSRHPNYFFEWVIWVSYALLALPAPYGWIGLFSPLGMLYILLRVTGVSLTEEHALRSRGEEYREYQRTTSMFIPLPRSARKKALRQ
jgi:steroid 5-alpha reductase family enzyme